MTVLMVKLCLFILILVPEHVWTGKFECGEHGKFEYCIDEIPGCVVGCYCYPGYYFDTNSKICEPNSNLLAPRRSLNSRSNIRKQKHKKSKHTEKRVTQEHQAIANEASDLTDWLHKMFFSEVEKEADKLSKTKHPLKHPKNKKKRKSKVKNKQKVRYFKSSKKYFRAKSEEAEPEIKESDLETANHSSNKTDTNEATEASDEANLAAKSTSDEATSLPKESGSVEATDQSEETDVVEESESSSLDNKSNSGDHDHQHFMLMQRPRRKTTTASPLLPSFIFLPNMDTPFYPPLGLPVPPVMPMYPAVPVPPMAVAPNFPTPVHQIAPMPLNPFIDVCSQCHEIIVKTLLKTTTPPNKRKKKKRNHTSRLSTTMEPTTETHIISTTKTTFESTADTTINSNVETTTGTMKNQNTSESTTEISTNSTNEIINYSTKTTVNSTTKIAVLNASIETTETSILTSSTVNDSYTHHDALRKAQDGIYHFLENLNSPNLFNRRKELKNQRMKTIRFNDRMLKKRGEFEDNSLTWTYNNSKDEPLMKNNYNISISSNMLQTILNKKGTGKEIPDTSNNDFKYISDLIHRPEFKDKIYVNSHRENNIKEFRNAQSHDKENDDFIKDQQNEYYSNLGRQIASLVRNSESEQERIKNNDFLGLQKLENTINVIDGTRHIVTEKVQENYITPKIGEAGFNNKNANWPGENQHNTINIKPLQHSFNENRIRDRGHNNKIASWSGTKDVLKYMGNSASPHNLFLNDKVESTYYDRKPNRMLQYQQSRVEGTKHAFAFNQQPYSVDFKITTGRPEISYIGGKFFSDDIL